MKHTGMTAPRTLAPRLRPSKTGMEFDHVAGTVGDFRKEEGMDRGMMAFLGLNGHRGARRRAATRKATTRRRPAKAKAARRLRKRR
jgi:hypothetical protein